MNVKLALIIATVPCLITGFFSFVGWRHEYRLRQLEHRGQEIQAIVQESTPPGHGRRSLPPRLAYRFSLDGRTYTGSSFVSEAVQQRTTVGDHIAVRFLPDAPEVSRPTGLPKIGFEVVAHWGLFAATAITLFGVCVFCLALRRLRRMETRVYAHNAA